ncbi:hypothetical protein [Mycobacterium colombiense]|nr:hypothetical protein [Mycobacterium colombiense]
MLSRLSNLVYITKAVALTAGLTSAGNGNPLIVQASNALLGVVLGILGSMVWLLGLVLCVTVLLIPLGIPVMKLGGRLFTLVGDLMHFP